MGSRISLLLCASLVCTTGSQAAASAKPDTPTSKRVKCEKVVGNLTGFGALIGATLIEGLKRDPKTPNDLKRCLMSKKNLQQAGECLEKDPKRRQAMREKAIGTCLTWPEDWIDCLGDFSKLESDHCQTIYRRMECLVDDSPGTKGPSPTFAIELGEEIFDALAVGDGLVIMHEKKLVGLNAKGIKLWSRAHEGAWLHALGPDRVLTTDHTGSIQVLSADTGKTLWRHELQAPKSGAKRPLATLGAARSGRIVLWLDDDRLAMLKPKRCRAKKPDCLTTLPTTRPGDGATPQGMRLGPDSSIWLGYPSRLVLVDSDGTLRMSLTGLDWPGPPAFLGRSVTLIEGERLVLIDPDRCAQAAKSKGFPADCVQASWPVPKADNFPPAVLDGSTFVTGGGRLLAVRDGKLAWKTEFNAEGAPRLIGGQLFVLEGWTTSTPSQLRVIDPASGRTIWASPVPLPRKFNAASFLVPGNTRIFVLGRTRAIAFKIPRRPLP